MLNHVGEKNLIASIIHTAFRDAIGSSAEGKENEARQFLNEENYLFKFYCNSIGMLPEYASKQIWKKINAHDTRKKRR